MSLTVPLGTTKTIVTRPALTKTVDQVVIEKIIDDPVSKTISVQIRDLGLVTIPGLSNDNYDNPQWSNESLAAAVVSYVNSL